MLFALSGEQNRALDLVHSPEHRAAAVISNVTHLELPRTQ